MPFEGIRQIGAVAALRGVRFFSSDPRARRVRRPTDVLLGLTVLLGLIGISFAAPGPTDLDKSIVALLDSLPGLAGWLWTMSYAALALWALLLLIVTAVSRQRRGILLDQVLAVTIAASLGLLISRAEGTSVDNGFRSLFDPGPPPTYLALRVAVVCAVTVATSPHLSVPMRWVGRTVITIGAVAGIALGTALPIGITAGFLLGVLAGALVHLLRGSPAGRPTCESVTRDLAEMGLAVTDLRDAPRQPLGAALFLATSPQGQPIAVKVLGRDAWDGQLLTSTWLALMRRGEVPRLMAGRFAQVEHEALATLLATQAGAAVLPVVNVGATSDGDAVLITAATERDLADLAAQEAGTEVLDAAWTVLGSLHRAGLAHGDLNGHRIGVRADGQPCLFGLSEAKLQADSGEMQMDRARLLVATAMVAGPEAAVSSAAHALGDQGLAEVLPYLQPAALDRYARTALKDQEWSLKDLSAAAVAAAGVEPPQLQQLRRVTAKSVVTVLLIAAVAYTLISLFSDVDLSEVVSEISTADWAYVAVGLVISAAIPTVQAVGTVASSIEPVRYGPVMALQYAIQFLALVLPASAARLALEVRFFQRFGMPAASALSIGMIDSFMGFLVQMALLGLIALGGLPGVTPRTPAAESASAGSSGGSSALWLAIALVVIGAAMVVLLPRLRRRVNRAVARWRGALVEQAHAARHSAGVLRRPGHVVTILGANLVIQVAYAVVLGICLAAFGGQADLAQLIFVNTAVSLFAGFMPVPGGMGVAEAGYTAGLQAIGVPSAVAISTALTFRLVTFYLPPIWGSFGMRWLKRNDFV